MSKSQAPAPAGQPTHGVTIRVQGAEPGTPAFRAIVERHQGALGQFYRAQQQQVAISGQRQYKVSQDVEGARFTYQNSEGQETVTITPRPQGEGEEKSKLVDKPWEFALIDIVVPNVTAGDIEFAAFLVNETPEQKAITANSSLPIQGISRHQSADVAKDPILAIAANVSGPNFIASMSDTDFYVSLRVDLRRYPNQGVKIDLYGYGVARSVEGGIPGPDDIVTNSLVYGGISQLYEAWTSSAGTPGDFASVPNAPLAVTAGGGSTDLFWYQRLILSHPELDGLAWGFGNQGGGQPFVSFSWNNEDGVYEPNGLGFYPNDYIFAGPQTNVYEYWAPGFPKKLTTEGHVVNYGGGGIATNVIETPPPDGPFGEPYSGVTISYWRDVVYFVPVYSIRTPRVAEVRAVCVKNGNPWKKASDRFTIGEDGARWEVEATYPSRPNMKTIGSISIPGKDAPDSTTRNSPQLKFGMDKIATLTIDTRTGAITVKAA